MRPPGKKLKFQTETLPAPNSDVSVGSFASILACPQHVRLWGNLGSADCPVLKVEGIGLNVIQAAKRGPRIMRYELTDFGRAAISAGLRAGL
jgi:hypothetical protein